MAGEVSLRAAVMQVLSQTEIVYRASTHQGEWEVCATARADYRLADSTLTVELDAFVRPVLGSGQHDGFAPPWLPPRKRVARRVPAGKARSSAQAILRRWVQSIRRSVRAAE